VSGIELESLHEELHEELCHGESDEKIVTGTYHIL
jgi:hypothetical protein